MSITEWHIGGGRVLDLRTPLVMAILNVTPDSFSDGGQLATTDAALFRATAALEAGADILDIGGESTRPGAERVSAGDQIRRVVPAIEAIRRAHPRAVISVDTTLAEVADASIDAGASVVNDVSGGRDDDQLIPLVARRGVGYVLMHRELPPAQDQFSDRYDTPLIQTSVVRHVTEFLRLGLARCSQAGIASERVVLDPGLGFGKTVEQNLQLIGCTNELIALGRPVLSGLSRKSFVGRVSLGRDSEPAERLAGTIALTALHRSKGASVFRVHDVAEAVQALRSADALASTARMTR